MRFKVISTDEAGHELAHFFDNKTLDITTDKGIPACLHNDPRFRDLAKPSVYVSQDEVISAEPQELRIQLGLNCNYSCRYCHQRFENAQATEHRVQLPMQTRVKRFLSLLQDKQVKPKSVALWGGEPLVYWKTIEELVPALREMYGDIPMHFLTNGSLLTDEVVDFCLSHRLSLVLSHDAHAFSAYRNDKNPLDNPTVMSALKRYIEAVTSGDRDLRFSINVVITPENAELRKIDDYFTSKFGFPVNWSVESVVRLGADACGEVSPFTLSDEKRLHDSMLDLCLYGIKQGRGIDHHIHKVLNSFVNNEQRSLAKYPCNNASKEVLITTLDGTLLACHGADESYAAIGHLKDLGKVKNTKLTSWQDRSQCQDCPFILLCKGGCPLVSDKDVVAACNNLKLWHCGLFRCAWLLLFNRTVQSVEPV